MSFFYFFSGFSSNKGMGGDSAKEKYSISNNLANGVFILN